LRGFKCEEYASDKEEKELAQTTHRDISAFLVTVSTRQAEVVDDKLERLNKLKRDFKKALNKEDVKRSAFKMIGELERVFARMDENIEHGWSSLQAKYRHFSDFDLRHKREKRGIKLSKCKTMTAQIKDTIAELLHAILTKLDSNVSSDSRQSLKHI